MTSIEIAPNLSARFFNTSSETVVGAVIVVLVGPVMPNRAALAVSFSCDPLLIVALATELSLALPANFLARNSRRSCDESCVSLTTFFSGSPEESEDVIDGFSSASSGFSITGIGIEVLRFNETFFAGVGCSGVDDFDEPSGDFKRS